MPANMQCDAQSYGIMTQHLRMCAFMYTAVEIHVYHTFLVYVCYVCPRRSSKDDSVRPGRVMRLAGLEMRRNPLSGMEALAGTAFKTC